MRSGRRLALVASLAFALAPAGARAEAAAGLAAAPPGALERAGRLLLLLTAVPLAGLLVLSRVLLPAEPALRTAAGRRLAAVRTALWVLEMLSLVGFTAGLLAAGGYTALLISATGPPLLVGIGVTAALGVAVFDGGALRAGEPPSLPTAVLGAALALPLLIALVALVEAPDGGVAGAVVGGLALVALGTLVAAAIAARVSGTGFRLPRRPAAPGARSGMRTLSLRGTVAPRFGRAAPAPPPTPAPEALPLPAGSPLHRRLNGHFVDLARLVETLESGSFTGYVRVDAGGSSGVIVLVEGELGAACFRGEEVTTGARAVDLLHRTRGDALLDVIGLGEETAMAVIDLISAPPLFSGLGARLINLDGVLEELRERGHDATVLVSAPADTGVILVRGGEVVGAYTRAIPRLHDTASVVTALACDPAAVIEVRIAPRRPESRQPQQAGTAALVSGATPVPSAADPCWDLFQEGTRAAGGE
jgi:hypothetical protein